MKSGVAEKVGMRLRPVALGVAVCVGFGTSAAAQAIPQISSARQFKIKSAVNVIYDTNVSRTSKALADLRGIEMRDVTVRPEVGLEVVQPLGRQLIYVNGRLGYEFHRENSELDRGRASVQGGYITRLGMCQGSASTSYRASQSDLATVDTLRVKNLQQTSVIGVGAQCGRSQGIVATVSAQRSETKNSATVQKLADSDSDTLGLGIGYGNATLGRLMLTYSYSDNELPNRITPGRPIGDGFLVQTYGVAVERKFGSRLNVNGLLGRSTIKREFAPPGTDLKFTSTNYAAVIAYKVGSRLNIDLSASRAVIPSVRAGKLYDIATIGEVRGRYSVGSRYTLTMGHRIADTDSNTDTFLNVPVVTNSRLKSTYGGISYRQSERVSLTLDARYDDRNTNVPDFNYKATTVGLTLEVGF